MTAPTLPLPARRQLEERGARFVLWRTTVRDDRPTKVPLRVDGRPASSTDPATWATLAACEAALAQGRVRADGLGFVLAAELDVAAGLPPIVGVDLDGCRDPATGEIERRCGTVIGDLASYAEVSPSDTGAKVLFLADPVPRLDAHKRVLAKAANGHDKDLAVEVYTTGRYFALTGRLLDGAPDELTDATEAAERLAALVAEGRHGKDPPAGTAPSGAEGPPSDATMQLIRGKPKLRALWEGRKDVGDVSASGLDWSLAGALGWHGLAAEEVARALRAYGHGQVGSGKLAGRDGERRLGRLLEEARRAGEARRQKERKRQEEPGKAADGPGTAPGLLSEDALALELGEGWGARARHVALWGKWLFWDGGRWAEDTVLAHLTETREFLRAKAAAFPKAAGELRKARTVAAVASLARSNRDLAAGVAQWDADPWRLNTPAGIVDLRTGELHPPDPLAYCTKSTAVAPAPPGTPAPLFQAFLERIFRHDRELIGFMRRVLGYGLTGLTVEHVLIFAWGQGANGKGTLFNTASRLLGDYAAVAPADLLLVTQSDRHPTDLAMLRGSRFVTAQELAPGRAWDEPKLKSLTGGDPITARFMRQDFFTYEPQFLLVAAGNHKPSFRGVDEAIRRRVKLVPFLQNIPEAERDKHLPEKLKAEWPAILRWAIDGCLAWQREGLDPPRSVQRASEEYLNAEDVLGQWLEERCAVSPSIAFTPVDALYLDWCAWCERGRLPTGSKKAFSQVLGERGFERTKQRGVMALRGIGLRDASSSERGEDGEEGHILDVTRARVHTHTSHMQETSPSSPRSETPGNGGSDPHQIDLEEAIAATKAAPSDPPPQKWAGKKPRPGTLPGPHDLEGWRARLRETLPAGRAVVVRQWVCALGGALDVGGVRVTRLPALEDGPVRRALLSALERYGVETEPVACQT